MFILILCAVIFTPLESSAAAEEMTKDEMVKEITDELYDEEEILQAMPQLKKESDESGKVFHTFNGRRLEDLDEETLGKLLDNVSSQATVIRTNRINKQLEAIKNIQRPNQAVRTPRPPPVAVTPIPPQAAQYKAPANPPRSAAQTAAPPRLSPPRTR